MKLANNISVDELRKKKKTSGAEATLVKLNPKLGVKFYRTRKERDFAYKMQKFAYKNGIGPAALNKVRINGRGIQHGAGLVKWGYVTQLVESLRISHEDLTLLSARMDKCGLSIVDIAEDANVGLLNGRPVCIDFGPISMDKETEFS